MEAEAKLEMQASYDGTMETCKIQKGEFNGIYLKQCNGNFFENFEYWLLLDHQERLVITIIRGYIDTTITTTTFRVDLKI